MSCEIRIAATIQEIPSIRRCLFPTDDQRGGENWLQTCEISASPTGDIIALGNERRLIILTSKWDSSSSTNHYQIGFADSIHNYDRIKAILCLPIVGQRQSSHVGPDWTCIALGFDSGFIRFYTENCELLMEEQLHCENISSMRCQSQHSPRPDISPELHPEEIYVQYQSNVCVINGPQLFAILRNIRSQLTPIKSAKGKLADFQQQPLGIKKWGFQDQSVINDVAVVGLNLSSTFDHLMTASICGGFDTKYKSTAPNSTLVLAAGSKPYIGYHYALEGANQPIFSDVAKAVASKLKSALPSWLTGSIPATDKEVSVAQQSVDAMGCRFGLCDLQRTANKMILSPNRRLGAVTDTLGRVVLVDSFRGVALKIFKGYRDAQCAFLQVSDERRSKQKPGNKVAHFLVIYAPKKGIIEIFTVQHGTKVATFSASRHSRLLYITHGLMGFTTTSKSRFVCQFTCVLVDNNGQIKELLIPFHFALAEKNSKRARDIHLYKKLRQAVKSGDFTPEKLQNEACNICSELKTLEVRKQTLEMLSNSRGVTAGVILNCAEYFLEDTGLEQDDELVKFQAYCSNLKSLLNLYNFASLNDNKNENNRNNSDDNKKMETLKVEGVELDKLQKLLDLSTVNDKDHFILTKVKFSDEVAFTISDFLASFNLTNVELVELEPQLDESLIFKTGETLFKKWISGEQTDFAELENRITSSCISVENLFHLLITYWVNRSLDINQNLENDMNNFLLLASTLARCVNEKIINTEYNLTSEFWGNIRNYLSSSGRSFPALMAAMLCKSVGHQLELEKSEVENIEVLSKENIQWSILIGKLEDISMLNIILSNKPITKNSTLPNLKFEKQDISLKYILQQGRGSVTELVAQWLTSSGIDPENIHINEIIYKNSDNNDSNGENKLEITEGMYLDKIEIVKLDIVFKYLNLLKTQFPYSLDSSAILANMCWEYALAWREDISDLSKLEAARECLLWVNNWSIQQGMHLLLWNTHLKIVVESTSKLINKVGKLPKERLCLQDTGLTDKQICHFVGICEDFFHSFLNIAQTPTEEYELKFEALWENGDNPSLIELACQHKDVDYSLLELHYLMVLVLQMITAFSVKHAKPLNNLFEASMVNLFFTDLQKNVDINWNKGDIKLLSSRTQFLYKIISASLETVTINEEGKIYCEKHVDWMAKCLALARGWNLDVESFKRYQILQLYINGFDVIAEELVSAVNETNELGVQLLAITGKRLSQYLSSSPDLGKNITALSPVLTRYLESLDKDWCSPSSLLVIKNLALIVVRCLNEDNKDFKLAELILDACLNLEEIHS